MFAPTNHSSAVMDGSREFVSGNMSAWKSLYDWNNKMARLQKIHVRVYLQLESQYTEA